MLDKSRAYRFIVLMGFVSLLADFTYESARGLSGPYLALLGASALWVSLVSGFAELLGYWMRLFSGFLSDRLKSYWTFTLSGYAINLFAVPLLGVASSWQSASLLILLERLGKGLRTPSRDVLLSGATRVVGHGKGFGLHEFLDQMGAVSGPLFVGFLLYAGAGYRNAFLLLFVPASLAMLLLLLAKNTMTEEPSSGRNQETSGSLNRTFYLYLFASCLIALSFLPFPLIGFHLSQSSGFEGWQVSLLFALAMGVDAVFALLFGFLYDRIGFASLVAGLSLGMFSPLLLFFFGQPVPAIILWGASLGVQESIMRSAIAQLSEPSARGRAYGLFHFFYGLSAFAGGVIMGLFYELSFSFLVLYCLILHTVALLILFRIKA